MPAERAAGASERSAGSSSGDRFVSGVVGGLVSSLLLQPFDVVKTRMQGVRAAGGESRPMPSVRIAVDLVRSNGVRSLWVPSVLRTSVGAGIYFTVLDVLMSREAHLSEASTRWYHALAAGSSARIIAVTALLPLHVVKTRFEWGTAHTGPFATFRTARDIVRRESVRGLFAGITPTLMRDGMSSGLYLMIFDALKGFIARSALGTRRTREEASRTLVPSLHPQAQHALAATLSGALTALLSNPVDVIKTRMQLQQRWRAADAAGNAPALSAHGVYRNSWHAATTIWRDEGARAFMYGAGPRMLNRALKYAVVWGVYEQMRKVLA